MGYKNLCTIKAPQDIHQAIFGRENATQKICEKKSKSG